ncbi:uncharacterized protein LAESUDRAFT_30674 [Laetiporus sulphureus 93-53]|uniref:Uncharacterized protein n=1 Tax=Laetiporus sulphureus 93-53 TaxID=1314785 RepID=A0A165IIV0_9APHY|nr:uncharacterized protein LAESUDRAFT_30674 [Laetiporus sulphureus 93-53]KZT13138.1 hypothetical protein LAESUDRAFT_30674 [Laetiporus sulphureus 93-53]
MGMPPAGLQQGSVWRQTIPGQSRPNPQRQPFNAPVAGRQGSFRSATTRSDQSDSAAEVERLIGSSNRHSARNATANWAAGQGQSGRAPQRVFAQPTPRRSSGGFRPAPVSG